MDIKVFLDRVFQHVPRTPVTSYQFFHWPVPGLPTEEAVGVLPVPGADPDKLVARVLDVDHYYPNLAHLLESRAIADARFSPPKEVHFYNLVEIPLISSLHHESVLVDGGVMNDWRVAYWYMLDKETEALSSKKAARSQYNMGAWLSKPGVVGYALSSAPRREDLNFLQWKALTTGSELAANKVIKANIENMSRWAAKL